MNRNTEIDRELTALCGGNSHPEYPFLRCGYSPVSRYPAADFTPWIAKKLEARRFEEIAYLMVSLTEPNPGGLGAGPDYWRAFAIQLSNLDLRKLVTFQDERAYRDFHSALFPYALRGSLDGFIIIRGEVEFLVRAVSPYPFGVPDLERKVAAANAFVAKMRRETKEVSAAWADFPLYDHEALLGSIRVEAPAHALRAKLREATIGGRQVFFGTLLEGPGQGAWSARPFGVTEETASQELVSLGLGLFLEDPRLALISLKKDELLTALAGYATKQGWSKKYIINYMMKEAPMIAERLSAGKRVVDILPSVRDDALALSEWSKNMKDPLAIAIGFG